MAFVFEPTLGLRAGPNVLVRDGVVVFGGDMDGEVGKAAGDFASPIFGFSSGQCGEGKDRCRMRGRSVGNKMGRGMELNGDGNRW